MWLSDVKVVLPNEVLAKGSIRIEDGKIAEIVEGPISENAIQCRGLTAVPGMIDIHGDMLEREIQPRPTAMFPIDLALYEVDKRLAASGVTTAYAAVSFAWHRKSDLRTAEYATKIIDTINNARPHLLTDHFVHARFEITNQQAGPMLKELLEQEKVHLISIMDHTPGQGQYRDIERYIKFTIQWNKQQDGIDLTEEEARRRIAEAQERPKCWDAVQEIAAHSKEHNVTLASHDDDSPEKVAMLDDLGVKLSEFPVTKDAAREAKNRGFHVAMGAPNAFRGTSTTVGNLSAQEAIEERLVDVLACDYHPSSLLHASFAMVQRGVLPLHEAVKLVSTNPADALGMHNKGTIEVGKRADIALVQEGERTRNHCTIRNGIPIYSDRFMSELNAPSTLKIFHELQPV